MDQDGTPAPGPAGGAGRGPVGLPAAVASGAAGVGAGVAATVVRALAGGGGPTTVVLVEGVSDQVAVEALARRQGRDLAAAGVAVVPMGGATNIRRFVEVFGPRGFGVRLGGLCDAGEAAGVRRGLALGGLAEGAGAGAGAPGPDLARAGFFVCDRDLEDELSRAAGADRVVGVVAAHGELRALRTLQKQAAQRGRGVDEQLRRFMGSRGGRKVAYARALVDLLAPAEVPRPLTGVLAHALGERLP